MTLNSLDKFRYTATSPRPRAPRGRRYRLHRGASTAVTPIASHETVIGDLNRRMSALTFGNSQSDDVKVRETTRKT